MDFLFKNCLFLAPMAGYSDAAYRYLLRKMGADFAISEFVHSRAVLSRAEAILDKIRISKDEAYCGIQIFGSEPSEMADCASMIEEEFSPAFIDINFGCPAPSAIGCGAGSALLKTPDKILKILSTIHDKLKHTPLTAKMRIGYSQDEMLLPNFIKELNQSPISMLSIHGRTTAQGYKGDSNWQIIEETASLATMPIIGNGSAQLLDENAIKNSHCFGFMIGRQALNDPWVFQRMKAKINGESFQEPQESARLELAKEYLNYIEEHCPNSRSQYMHAKAQLLKFVRMSSGSKQIRIEIAKSKDFNDLKNILL
ncbi:MAG: tRNA-dihydrouridine synthase family protein [Opitutales bacterium]